MELFIPSGDIVSNCQNTEQNKIVIFFLIVSLFFVNFLPFLFRKSSKFMSVLDGELAVPCNLKSAYAGLNPGRRVLLSLKCGISGDENFSFTQ